MALNHCPNCTTAYALSLEACPNCRQPATVTVTELGPEPRRTKRRLPPAELEPEADGDRG